MFKALIAIMATVLLLSSPATAQEKAMGPGGIKFSADSLKDVSPEDKVKIRNILRDTKLIPQDAELSYLSNINVKWWNPVDDIGKTVCRAACDAAANIAAAACSGLSGGAAVAACLLAAEVARNYCRERC